MNKILTKKVCGFDDNHKVIKKNCIKTMKYYCQYHKINSKIKLTDIFIKISRKNKIMILKQILFFNLNLILENKKIRNHFSQVLITIDKNISKRNNIKKCKDYFV